jgi:hypothetical protein
VPIRALALKSIPVLREHLEKGVPLIAVKEFDSGEAASTALRRVQICFRSTPA